MPQRHDDPTVSSPFTSMMTARVKRVVPQPGAGGPFVAMPMALSSPGSACSLWSAAVVRQRCECRRICDGPRTASSTGMQQLPIEHLAAVMGGEDGGDFPGTSLSDAVTPSPSPTLTPIVGAPGTQYWENDHSGPTASQRGDAAFDRAT